MRYIVEKTGFDVPKTTSSGTPKTNKSNPDQPVPQDDNLLGPPTAKTFLGTPLNSQQTLNELYNAGYKGQIKTAGDFVGPLQ